MKKEFAEMLMRFEEMVYDFKDTISVAIQFNGFVDMHTVNEICLNLYDDYFTLVFDGTRELTLDCDSIEDIVLSNDEIKITANRLLISLSHLC